MANVFPSLQLKWTLEKSKNTYKNESEEMKITKQIRYIPKVIIQNSICSKWSSDFFLQFQFSENLKSELNRTQTLLQDFSKLFFFLVLKNLRFKVVYVMSSTIGHQDFFRAKYIPNLVSNHKLSRAERNEEILDFYFTLSDENMM